MNHIKWCVSVLVYLRRLLITNYADTVFSSRPHVNLSKGSPVQYIQEWDCEVSRILLLNSTECRQTVHSPEWPCRVTPTPSIGGLLLFISPSKYSILFSSPIAANLIPSHLFHFSLLGNSGAECFFMYWIAIWLPLVWSAFSYALSMFLLGFLNSLCRLARISFMF